jgi:hypothetical protein
VLPILATYGGGGGGEKPTPTTAGKSQSFSFSTGVHLALHRLKIYFDKRINATDRIREWVSF